MGELGLVEDYLSCCIVDEGFDQSLCHLKEQMYPLAFAEDESEGAACSKDVDVGDQLVN